MKEERFRKVVEWDFGNYFTSAGILFTLFFFVSLLLLSFMPEFKVQEYKQLARGFLFIVGGVVLFVMPFFEVRRTVYWVKK